MKKTEKNTDFSLIDVLLWGITILLAVVLGIFLDVNNPLIKYLTIPAFVVLRLLVAFAIPMFFLVIINNLITLKFTGKTWYRVLLPLLSNTTFAIIIGFVVVNLIQPGNWADLIPFEFANPTQPTPDFANIDNFWDAILKFIQNLVPASLIEPLVNNNVMQIIVVSFSLGIVLRAIKSEQKQQDKPEFTEEENINFQPLENAIGVLLEAVKNIWKWVIDNHLLKLAVFGILLKNIALQGVVTPLVSLVLFVLTMLVALLVQACYYLLRIQFGSWVKPLEFLCKGRKVFIEAFETASSNRTLDTARQIFKDKIPLREASVYLGVNIGSNFNRDGTIILMVTSVLYISQMLGENLSFGQFFILILISIFASTGGPGISNTALVSLTLVFTAVGLPIDYIAVILSVDWLLDRCYTVINVMGYMTASILLDGKKPYRLNKAS